MLMKESSKINTYLRLYYIVFLLLIFQGLIFGEKIYIGVLGFRLSLIDGVIPTLLFFLYFLLTIKYHVKITITLYHFIPFLIYIVLSILTVGFFGNSIVLVVRICLLFLSFMFGFMMIPSTNKSNIIVYKSIYNFFSKLLIIIIITQILFLFSNPINDPKINRFNSVYGTYVDLGYFSSLILMFFFTVYLIDSGQRNNRLVLYIISSFTLLLFSGSRTALFSTFFVSATVLYFSEYRKSFIKYIIVILVLSLVYYYFNSDQIRFIKGTEDFSFNFSLTGREVWYYVTFNEALKFQPFGAGVGYSDLFVLNLMNNKIYSTHSQILQLFFDFGFIGISLFFFGWILYLLKFRRLISSLSNSYQNILVFFGYMVWLYLIPISITDSIWDGAEYFTIYIFLFGGITYKIYVNIKNNKRLIVD